MFLKERRLNPEQSPHLVKCQAFIWMLRGRDCTWKTTSALSSCTEPKAFRRAFIPESLLGQQWADTQPDHLELGNLRMFFCKLVGKLSFFFLSYRPCQGKIGWNETGWDCNSSHPLIQMAACLSLPGGSLHWAAKDEQPSAHQLALITAPAVLGGSTSCSACTRWWGWVEWWGWYHLLSQQPLPQQNFGDQPLAGRHALCVGSSVYGTAVIISAC